MSKVDRNLLEVFVAEDICKKVIFDTLKSNKIYYFKNILVIEVKLQKWEKRMEAKMEV